MVENKKCLLSSFTCFFPHGVNWLVSQTVSFHLGIIIKQRDKRENGGGGQSHDSLILESWGTRMNEVSVGDEGSDSHSGILKEMVQAGACSSDPGSTGGLGLR